jgi:hypothetical protein
MLCQDGGLKRARKRRALAAAQVWINENHQLLIIQFFNMTLRRWSATMGLLLRRIR